MIFSIIIFAIVSAIAIALTTRRYARVPSRPTPRRRKTIVPSRRVDPSRSTPSGTIALDGSGYATITNASMDDEDSIEFSVRPARPRETGSVLLRADAADSSSATLYAHSSGADATLLFFVWTGGTGGGDRYVLGRCDDVYDGEAHVVRVTTSRRLDATELYYDGASLMRRAGGRPSLTKATMRVGGTKSGAYSDAPNRRYANLRGVISRFRLNDVEHEFHSDVGATACAASVGVPLPPKVPGAVGVSLSGADTYALDGAAFYLSRANVASTLNGDQFDLAFTIRFEEAVGAEWKMLASINLPQVDADDVTRYAFVAAREIGGRRAFRVDLNGSSRAIDVGAPRSTYRLSLSRSSPAPNSDVGFAVDGVPSATFPTNGSLNVPESAEIALGGRPAYQPFRRRDVGDVGRATFGDFALDFRSDADASFFVHDVNA